MYLRLAVAAAVALELVAPDAAADPLAPAAPAEPLAAAELVALDAAAA